MKFKKDDSDGRRMKKEDDEDERRIKLWRRWGWVWKKNVIKEKMRMRIKEWWK